MEKMNFYHKMFDVALKACGNCDIITRYDMQFNPTRRTYSARVWTVRGHVFDVTEEEYSHGEKFTVTEIVSNKVNWYSGRMSRDELYVEETRQDNHQTAD